MPRTKFLATVLLTSVIASGPALAHAFLKSATPSVGSAVRTPPADIVINYTEGVEPKFGTITVQDASGTRMETGDVQTAPGNDKRLTVGLKPLKPGVYKVTWHVTSTDTHKTEGSYNFTVSP